FVRLQRLEGQRVDDKHLPVISVRPALQLAVNVECVPRHQAAEQPPAPAILPSLEVYQTATELTQRLQHEVVNPWPHACQHELLRLVPGISSLLAHKLGNTLIVLMDEMTAKQTCFAVELHQFVDGSREVVMGGGAEQQA